MARVRTKVTKTFIIIATMDVDPTKTFASMFLSEPLPQDLEGMKFCEVIPLDRPMIVSPKGLKGLEVIPVDREIVLHGRGLKRRLVPP